MYCKTCGKEVNDKALVCVHCGCAVNPVVEGLTSGVNLSNKRGIIVLLLCFFLGGLGIHRFYVGKMWTGLLMLLTFGCLGIMVIYDLIMIVLGKFTDNDGNVITL